MKNIIVIGDKFRSFSNGEDIVTLSQLSQLVKTVPVCKTQSVLIAGQGIDGHAIGNILHNITANPEINYYYECADLYKTTYQYKNNYTHKHDRYNILVGQTQQIDEHQFTLPLLIDENCELMADHQTGQHIQGMLLVEAFRQTFICVTDEYFPLPSDKQPTYHVINHMNTAFKHFVFPLPTHIIYEITEKNVNGKRGVFSAIIHAVQNQQVCAEMKVAFSVFPQDIMSRKELALANQAARSIMQNREKAPLHNYLGRVESINNHMLIKNATVHEEVQYDN